MGPLRMIPKVALLLGLIGFANAAIWSLVTPIGQTPDEWAHVAYVQSLAERGKVPSRDPGNTRPPASAEEAVLLDEMRSFTVVIDAQLKPPWSEAQVRHWRTYVSENKPARDNGGGYTTIASHPPLYYLSEVVPYEIGSGSSLVTRIQLMRLLTALFAGLTVLFTWLLARELLGRRWLATTAAISVAFLPMFGFMGGAVNNDVPVAMFATLELFLLIRALRRGLTPGLGLAIGLVLGLGALTKGNMLAFVPIVALAAVFCAWRERSQLRSWAIGAATLVGGLAVTAALWKLFDLVLVPDASGGSGPVVPANGTDFHLLSSYIWQFYLPKLPFMQELHFGIPGQSPVFTLWVNRFWGSFGWLTVNLPRWVYRTIEMAMVGGIALAAVAVYRERAAVMRRLPELCICLLSVLAVVVLVHRLFLPGSVGLMAEQGRYLFPIVGVFGLAVAGACLAAGRRWGTVLAVACASLMMALNAVSVGEVARQFFS